MALLRSPPRRHRWVAAGKHGEDRRVEIKQTVSVLETCRDEVRVLRTQYDYDDARRAHPQSVGAVQRAARYLATTLGAGLVAVRTVCDRTRVQGDDGPLDTEQV